jgi:hypothetical protein
LTVWPIGTQSGDDRVILLDPFCRLLGFEKGEGERAEPVARGEVDRLAPRARHPHRRVRLLHRFRHDVAAWHVKPAAAKSRIRAHRQHIGGLLRRLLPHRALVVGIDAKPAHFDRRRRLAGPPLDAAVRDEVERGDAFGDPRRVVVFGRHQRDAVAEADLPRALRACSEKNLGRGGVRILLEEMVLDLPDILDAEPVGELDLVERLLTQALLRILVPRLRQLVLIEEPEFHPPRSSRSQLDQRGACFETAAPQLPQDEGFS